MDRASDSGSEGWGFESLPAHKKRSPFFGSLFFCFVQRREQKKKNPTVRWTVGGAGWTAPNLTICQRQIATSPFRAGSARSQFRTKLVCNRSCPDPPGVVTAVEIGVSITSIKYQPKSRPSAYLPLAPSGTCGASSLRSGAMGCIPFHIGLLQYVKCQL